MQDVTLYDAAGGEAGMLALATAWHTRCLADPVAAHPFEHGVHPQHRERLAAYWAESLGGPATYTGTMADETHVVRAHSGEGDHVELDVACIACFDQALTDVGVTDEPLRGALHDWFVWNTGRLSGRPGRDEPTPDGLELPRWPA